MTGKPIGEDDLQAAIDGRLDEPRQRLVEAYLAAHPELAARVAEHREHRQALRARLQAKYDEPVPPRLRVAGILAARRSAWRRRLGRAAAAALLVLIGGAAGWTLRGATEVAAVRSPLTQEAIVAYRTYVVEARHPVEVDAGQEAHLVQWLSRRIGRPLKAPDLAAYGYKLMGGRLLPADVAPAAQLMYQNDRGERLTVYLRADPDHRGTSFRFAEEGGVAAFYWVDDGFGYAVSGPANRQALVRVAEAVYQQTAQQNTN
jgi:anti-sigma factor RsiW